MLATVDADNVACMYSECFKQRQNLILCLNSKSCSSDSRIREDGRGK